MVTWHSAIDQILITALMTFPVAAHEAQVHSVQTKPMEWYYDGECCSGKDCDFIPLEQVNRNDDGSFTVIVFPGQNQNVLAPVQLIFYPGPQIHTSGDGWYHICVVRVSKPNAHTLEGASGFKYFQDEAGNWVFARCMYEPPMF